MTCLCFLASSYASAFVSAPMPPLELVLRLALVKPMVRLALVQLQLRLALVEQSRKSPASAAGRRDYLNRFSQCYDNML